MKVERYVVRLVQVELLASIGFHARERGRPQRLHVGVAIELDPGGLPGGDDPAQVWDYDAVHRLIHEEVLSGHFELQETLARRLAERLLAMPGVQTVEITLAKPDIYPDARSAGILLSARR